MFRIAASLRALKVDSRFASSSARSSTHLLERMAFKSTTNRSHLRIVREVEAIGGNVTASASREQMGYSYDALKTYVPEMLELLVDCLKRDVVATIVYEIRPNPSDHKTPAESGGGFSHVE